MNIAPVIRSARRDEAAILSDIAFAAKQFWNHPDEWLAAGGVNPPLPPTISATGSPGRRKSVAPSRASLGWIGGADGWHLEHLWLSLAFIGQGLGRAPGTEALREARAAGAAELHIKTGPRAKTFCLRMGAVRTGLEVYELPGKIRHEVPLPAHAILRPK